jgi:glutamate dehydrogenase (NADP+)
MRIAHTKKLQFLPRRILMPVPHEPPTIEAFMEGLVRRNPGETEFHQSVQEVAESIFPYIADKPKYHEWEILRRIAEPDRIIIFRVCWEDDKGNIRVNRGYRVQNNNSIGPYKGGIRFHPSVTLSVLKFLGFEQTFKNSLTGLPMGGGKGGADFNPKGKSDNEVMNFCQSFMSELFRHVGEDTDVPAGDIGVGAREIGYMFGQYKRITNKFVGVLTGKGMEFGGSPIRTEATGYGTVYMMQDMLKVRGHEIEGKNTVISGSGNVATYAAQKIIQLGGNVTTLSDSAGFVYAKNGMTQEQLEWVMRLKTVNRGRISEAATEFGWEYREGERPWGVPCDIALPCATQNELDEDAAKTLIKNGCLGVAEGANMPSSIQAVHAFQKARMIFAPAKAANAGGVAVSGLEMSQNSARITWKEEELEQLLRDIMQGIHDSCREHGTVDDNYIDYVNGANIAGFIKVADAMIAYGVV